jgi:Domain of unknown function (DUF222)/HNH endonuclease
MSASPAPGSAKQAMDMMRRALEYLAAAGPAGLPSAELSEYLCELERLAAIETAVRASLLAAFAAGQGPAADAAHSLGAWLMHKTGVSRGGAAGLVGWMRRGVAHPEVAVALADGDVLTESVARNVCKWTDRLPADCRQAADEILVAAARAGADEEDLARLAAEMIARAQSGSGGAEDRFADRSVRLETTFDGAGVLRGDLTPECTAFLTAVLESLSVPAGADDERTRDQRYHDALQEAARRLVAAGLLPERAGQPVKAWVHVSLAELRALDQDSKLEGEWIGRVRGEWAAARAGASVGGGDGAAWLEGDAARAVCCDASLTPVVTGEANVAALDGLVRLCVELARLDYRGHAAPGSDQDEAGAEAETTAVSGRAREALERAIIGAAVDLVSGPGGLASFLRTRELGARLGGPSLPLDVGYSDDVPPSIRRAVMLRAQGHCEWAGGCRRPAWACEVHHVVPKSEGGKTSVQGCVLLCPFHHQVCIHRMGWTLVVNGDGTTSAWNKDKSKILHSHGPPPRPG